LSAIYYDNPSEDFENVIKNNDKLLIDFYADWCAPCRMMSPVLDQIAKENEDIKVIKVNIEEYQDLAEIHEVKGIPFMKVFKDGEEFESLAGFRPKENLQEILDKL
jgi:thioredoxin 1